MTLPMNNPVSDSNIECASDVRANDVCGAEVTREWLARLELELRYKNGKTHIGHLAHLGPLRVQKPFYPEPDNTCHVYLLHPPGGMVVGDTLQIDVSVQPQAQAVLTTPSAGKIYGTGSLSENQQQTNHFTLAEHACLEWLPQETIVFDGARANIRTRFDITLDAKVFAWDIVRLGRAASGERFTRGFCHQAIEFWSAGLPIFIERNRLHAGNDVHSSMYGLQAANTMGTLCATMCVERDCVDQWLSVLNGSAEQSPEKNLWGLTQKGDMFIARYLGESVTQCRSGFEYIWRQSRETFNGKKAVPPRIWRT